MNNEIQYLQGKQDNNDEAYAQALKAIDSMFSKQQARIAEKMEEARAAAEQSGFADPRKLARVATHAARVSWEADEQMAVLKRRLDELYRERVVEPIMEIRRLSAEMEQRNSNHFRRRIGDVPR